jgi:TetR/AcrR family transcriptional regulator, lmrAB and yxaGH operons repressor
MVTTTAKLLRRQGYHGTGLNQIVAEADAPKGSLYFHFPGGKEQLAAEAIIASGIYLDAGLVACQAPTALQSLDAYIAEAAALLERTDYTSGCPIATVALEVGATSPTISAACADAFELLLGRVAGWLERDGVDPEQARERAIVVYSALEGALVFAKARRSVEPLAALRRQLPSLLSPIAVDA